MACRRLCEDEMPPERRDKITEELGEIHTYSGILEITIFYLFKKYLNQFLLLIPSISSWFSYFFTQRPRFIQQQSIRRERSAACRKKLQLFLGGE